MTWRGLTPVAKNGMASRPAVMAIADHAEEARAAVSRGADIIDLGDIDLRDPARGDIAAFLTGHPGVAFCVSDAGFGAAITRRLATALADDAVLICGDLAAARACGHPAGQLVVLAQPGEIAAVRLAGYSAMVDADPASVPGSVAAAALSGWLGASIVRTRHPLEVGRGLDMAAVIGGILPPVRAVRGLA